MSVIRSEFFEYIFMYDLDGTESQLHSGCNVWNNGVMTLLKTDKLRQLPFY